MIKSLQNGRTPQYHWKRVSDQYEYVTLDSVKDHLNIYDSSEDDSLKSLMWTASQLAEDYVGDFFNPTSIALYMPTFSSVSLPHRGATTITSIQYLDVDNVLQTLPAINYYLDLTVREPTILFAAGFVRPVVSTTRNNPVTVTYVTKLGDISTTGTAVDLYGGSDIKMAVLMYCSEMYFNGDNITDGSVNKLPLCSERLLAKYRRVVV